MAECHLMGLVYGLRELENDYLYVHLRSLFGCYARNCGIFEDAAIEEFHNVEVAAYHTLILAECVGFWNGDVGLLKGVNDAVFAVDFMGCLEQVVSVPAMRVDI